MLFLHILMLIATLFLIFYANLNIWIGGLLFIYSAGYLIIQFTLAFFRRMQVNKLKQKFKLKWIGVFVLQEGFDLVPNQYIYLGLTRKDTLAFLTEQKQITISIEDIEGILLSKGSVISYLSDFSLKKLLNRNSKANVFLNIQNLIQKNIFLKSKYFLMMSLSNKYNTNHNIRWTQDLVILKSLNRYHYMINFMKRPEIRSKAMIYTAKNELKNVNK